jgi:hypothetical protein
MRTTSFLCFMLLFSFSSFAQKLEVKKKLKVAINKAANPAFKVRVIDPEKDTVAKIDNVTYTPDGKVLSFQQKKELDWSKANPFDYDSIHLPPPLASTSVLSADIKPDEGRLMVYFWPYKMNGSSEYSNDSANLFLKNHVFSIALEDRVSVSFHSSSLQAGALTVPIKAYLGAPDSVSSVQAASSVGIYGGIKWGRTKFVKLPSEKEYTTYQSAVSLNVFAGVNALELKEENTSDKGVKFKGTVTTLSLGVATGWHYKTFTLFLASGFDIPLSKKAANWSLKGKPWIGFGAGFEIF